MNEQQPDDNVQTQQPAEEEDDELAFPDLKPGDAWGESITQRRAGELEAILQQWATEERHGTREAWLGGPLQAMVEEPREKRSPFDGEWVTGAEVYWLTARVLAGSANKTDIAIADGELRNGDELLPLPQLHLEGASFLQAHLERANLWEVHLEGASLREAHLEGADLWWTHLEGADLRKAHLEHANLHEAHLEGASLREAHLEGADLHEAHLERVTLTDAHLAGATLTGTHLEGTDLRQAHLDGKQFTEDNAVFQRLRRLMPYFPAALPPTDLRRAFLDRATQLDGVQLGDAQHGYVRVADTRWGEVNLAVVDWGDHPVLQDERAAKEWKPPKSHPTQKPSTRREWRRERRLTRHDQRATRVNLYRAASRANRQLATVLRTQGLNDEADKFAYRAQVLQRQVFWQQRALARAFFSGLLDLVAGYGYRPGRSLITYLATIAVFALVYWCVTNDVSLTHGLFTHVIVWLGMKPPPTSPDHLQGYEAVVVSMTSFHGRGFFQPIASPGDKVAILAAFEAALGLLIEITFIATFTQRFFAR